MVHTAENYPDHAPPDAGAENVAAYQARTTRPSSYHHLVDSDSDIAMLPDEAVAFGARGANANGWHISFATRAAKWDALPDWWVDAALYRAAEIVARKVRAFKVPVRRLSRAQFLAGQSGLVAHAQVDPTRRTDPGASFPWDRFLALVNHHLENEDMALKRGSKGNSVRVVQKALLRWRKDILPKFGADSDFGSETEAAVRAYQKAADLPVTGIVDGVTSSLLIRYLTASYAHKHDDLPEPTWPEHDHPAKPHEHTATVRLA